MRILKSPLFLILLFTNCVQSQSDNNIVFIREFYKNYITECSKMPLNIAKIDELKRKSCSEKLLKKINKEENDYDIFLNAQDCELEWINALTISKSNAGSDNYIVSYFDAGSETKVTINLLVISVNNQPKIDAVW